MIHWLMNNTNNINNNNKRVFTETEGPVKRRSPFIFEHSSVRILRQALKDFSDFYCSQRWTPRSVFAPSEELDDKTRAVMANTLQTYKDMIVTDLPELTLVISLTNKVISDRCDLGLIRNTLINRAIEVILAGQAVDEYRKEQTAELEQLRRESAPTTPSTPSTKVNPFTLSVSTPPTLPTSPPTLPPNPSTTTTSTPAIPAIPSTITISTIPTIPRFVFGSVPQPQ
jgi:hypothetical protein